MGVQFGTDRFPVGAESNPLRGPVQPLGHRVAVILLHGLIPFPNNLLVQKNIIQNIIQSWVIDDARLEILRQGPLLLRKRTPVRPI